jgi:hypothetical protein
MRPLFRLCALHCSIAIVMGCGGGSGTTCTTDEQCASHFCRIDGTCGPAGEDAGTSADSTFDGSPSLCTPNHDGTITASELPLAAGAMANFLIATNATWDTAGSGSGSSLMWDLSGALSGDTKTAVALGAPSGTWWQAKFSAATYDVQLISTSDLQGVFQVGSAGVTLLGVVSPSSGTEMTELTYDPPATMVAVPFTLDSTWSSTSSVTGYADGVLAAYQEEYQSTVDATGTMKTPYGTFPVLRVATNLTRSSGGVTLLTTRTFAWFAECFGSVAQATSQDDETGDEFDSEAEVRRLTP